MDSWRERLAYEIHARGLKLTKLSTALGFHRDYVSNVLTGKAKPSTDKLERICAEIGVPMSDILSGKPAQPERPAPPPNLAEPALSSVQSLILSGKYNKA